MLSHQFKDQFLAAATKEYTDLERRDTFSACFKNLCCADILPLMWFFTFKFDTDGFLSMFKARIFFFTVMTFPTVYSFVHSFKAGGVCQIYLGRSASTMLIIA